MLNSVVLVGRLTSDPTIIEGENGLKRSTILIAVPRSYKNLEGKYETDFIRCTLWNMVASHTCEYCKKGDVVGVKGRVQSSTYEKDGKTEYRLEIIAEKISFLSSTMMKEE